MRLASCGLLALLLAAPAAADELPPWPQHDADALPAGAWGDTVRYGRDLILHTAGLIGPEVADPAMRYAGNNLACGNCHLAGGTQRYGLPLQGVWNVFPTFIGREGEVRTLEERINGCMERSMNGRALPVGGREMKALLSYIAFLSTGDVVGKPAVGRSTPALPLLDRPADPAHGAQVYVQTCAVCHGPDGHGVRNPGGAASGYQFPPLWGPDSYNDGAGMHRLITAAQFIHANMPLGTTFEAPTLSVADAWDVAAYVNTQPRPKMQGLDRDYPVRAHKPVDAPFPPYADAFPPAQHQLGPFQPILDAQKTAARTP
jgi:thiosulfate dehydrogenase